MSGPHSSDNASAPEHLLDSASLISKKWNPVIVRCLSDSGGLGYSDIERRLDGVSPKVLTDALEELQEHRVIDRTELSQSPLRVEYTLTDRGDELATIVDSLANWGKTHLTGPEQVVLVADDDDRFLLMHETWLEDDYTVRVAGDGEQALRQLDTDVGVVLLDRRMPGLSGEEVLDWIRSQRYNIRVVMITAEDPSSDLLDLPFDEYLTKPVFEDEVRSVVADLFERREVSSQLQSYLGVRPKLALLEAETPPGALEASEEYERLRESLDQFDVTEDEVEAAAPEMLASIAERRSP
jgi:DNA-binding HxlR family transcriptional regulator/DNA-binding response OmpR family regulator